MTAPDSQRDPGSRPVPATGDALFEAVYARLKAMAANQLAAAPPGGTLQATALVHELYLRMQRARDLKFSHEAPFFAYAAHAMRHLLADRARDRKRLRAGGDWMRVTLTGIEEQVALDSADEALALDAAIEKLAAVDARAARVLEMRYFAGLSVDDVALALDTSPRTIDRDWLFARAFLQSELGGTS